MKNFNELREIISEDYFTVQYYNGNGSVVDDKFKNFKSKAEADKYAKKGNKIDSVGGEYKTFKVKGRMESVEIELDTLEENMKNIAKAMTGLASKPEFKKISKNLKSLSMRAGEGDKGAAKQIRTQLAKLAAKVDKKSGAKLTKMSKLVATYESVELDEMKEMEYLVIHTKKGQLDVKARTSYDAAKKAADKWKLKSTSDVSVYLKTGIKKESVEEGWKKKKKNEECGLDHDTLKKKKMKKHMDDVHEDEELEEGVSLSKKGNYEVTVDGKSAVGIRIGLRFKGKLIVPGTKQKGLFVMGFNKKDGKHKLPPGATIVKDSGKYVHIGFKKVDDIIAYAVLENITEEVANKTFTEFRNLT